MNANPETIDNLRDDKAFRKLLNAQTEKKTEKQKFRGLQALQTS